MRYIYVYSVVLVLVLSACNPCKRLIKLCPPNDSISYVETIDTVIVTVPGSTESVEFPLGSIGLTHETQAQQVDVVIRNDTIFITATCKEQEAEIYQLRTALAEQKTIIERVEIPTYVTKNSKYHTLAGILAPILLSLIALGVYLKFK